MTAKAEDVSGSDLLIRDGALQQLARVDALFFDIDGVIMNVADTFRVVVCETVATYLKLMCRWEIDDKPLSPNDTELFKHAGGFNNDWDLTQAACLFYLTKSAISSSRVVSVVKAQPPSLEEYTDEVHQQGGGLQTAERLLLNRLTPAQRRQLAVDYAPNRIISLFQEIYGGRQWCRQLYGFDPVHIDGDGYVDRERVILDASLLPRGGVCNAVLSGRTRTEAEIALRKAGILERIDARHILTHDDGLQKPDPRTLSELLNRTNARCAIYIGDTLDDLRTVQNYRDRGDGTHASVLSCLVLSGPAGAANQQTFLEHGVEILAPDVNAFLTFFNGFR